MSTPTSDSAYLSRALKAPRIRESAERLAEQAREVGWSHEEYLPAVLATEVTSREGCGAFIRIRAAGFGTVKSIDDFNFEHQPGAKRDTIATSPPAPTCTPPPTSSYSDHPEPAKPHLAIGLAVKAAHQGHRVLFAFATAWSPA